MKALLVWLDDRTGLSDALRREGAAESANGASWHNAWAAGIAFAFCIEAITGFFLWCYYSPSRQTAWESVYYLQNEVVGGWLLRAIHHYTAHVLVAMLIMSIVASILTRAYRAPRELVFWVTVGLGLCALAAFLTGDLLPWEQNGYAATKTRTGFLLRLPWVGNALWRLAIGGPGPELGQLALARFFALHVALFSGSFLLLMIVRRALVRRASVAGTRRVPSLGPADAASTPSVENTANGSPVARSPFPASAHRPCEHGVRHLLQWRSAVMCLLVLAVVLLLSCQHGITMGHAGVPLLSPANPAETYNAARPEWFLVGVFRFAQWFPAEWEIVPIFIIPGLLVCIVLAMPFTGKCPVGHRFNVVSVATVVTGLAVISYYSLAKDRLDLEYQKAVASEQTQTQRVGQLARYEGIPPGGASATAERPEDTGAETVCPAVRQLPQPRRRRQWVGTDLRREAIGAWPDLAGYSSRQWLAGLLDPKQIDGPKYFGNTKLRGGKMSGAVKGIFEGVEADERKTREWDLQKVIQALSAEAGLLAQRAADAKDAEAIAEGRKLLVEDFGCTDCHKFHDKGTLGHAPELTGYGSRKWITGIISNPADKQYYGQLNDRMPAYAPSADPAQNTLRPGQIELLTDWLRGEWYEEGRGEKRMKGER